MIKRSLICLAFVVLVFAGCAENNINTESTEYETEAIEAVTMPTEIEIPENKSSVADKIIVVDAGHGINSYNKKEPIAPSSSETKNAFATGTHGAAQTEEELNLSVAIKLEEQLVNKGAKVYMTRNEHKCDMTNVDRAVFANELNADISVKLHADGNNNSAVHGVSVLVPGDRYITDSKVTDESRIAGELILEEFVLETGAANRGISVRNDLTGFNWSKVPIVLVEMGFMTNPDEDKKMATEEYRDKIVQGIVSGLEKYFEAEECR